MIIKEVRGDILRTGAQTLVCPTNCVGVMGAGLARMVKITYPNVWRVYQTAHRSQHLHVQRLIMASAVPGRFVLLFPTKDDWRRPSRLEWVEANLRQLAEQYRYHGITSLAIPPVGCGLGGLDYDRHVRPLIDTYLDPILLPVTVYLPEPRSY